MPVEETQELLLPRFVGSADAHALFLLCSRIRSATGDIVLDGQNVQFVDPLGLAVLGAVLEPLADRRIFMQWLPTDVAGYLNRMNFFARCTLEGVEIPPHGRNDRRSDLVELTCVSNGWEVDEAASRLSRAITGYLTDADPDEPGDEPTGTNRFDSFNHPLQYSLSELLENSLSHARREGRADAKVWLAAQHYKSRGLIRMAVVDNGCGMLATLRDHASLEARTHQAAVAAALIPRVSCNRDVGVMIDSVNQGVGLTTTYRIAEAAGGNLTIISGDANHNTVRGTARMRGPAFWEGVAISFVCRRDLLPKVRVSDHMPELDAPAVAIRFED